MNKLVDRNWQPKPASGPRPFIPYRVGQQCTILDSSEFKQNVDLYYPLNSATIISECLDQKLSYHYEIKMIGVQDILRVSHWDIGVTVPIEESRTFAKLSLVRPGVRFRDLGSGDEDMVREFNGESVSTLNGKEFDKDTIVVLLVEPRMSLLSESLLHEGTPGVVGTGINPEASVPSTSYSGRPSGVRRLGRAHKEREQEQDFELEKLKKEFPTRDEVKNALEKIDDKTDDAVRLKALFAKMGDALG